MRRRSLISTINGNLKRKATKNRNDLAYMMIWGEEPPKKHTMRPRKPRPSLRRGGTLPHIF